MGIREYMTGSICISAHQLDFNMGWKHQSPASVIHHRDAGKEKHPDTPAASARKSS